MRMTQLVPPRFCAWIIAGLLVLTSASTAHARRGIMLITTGDAIKNVGEVADSMKAQVAEGTGQAGNLRVGLLHSRFGIFWVDIWTWGGMYVLYDDNDQVWEITREDAAELMGVEPNQVGKPIFYTIPPGLVVLGLVGAGWMYNSRRQSKQTRLQRAELDAAAADPRYQRALGFLDEYYRQRDAAPPVGADGPPPDQASADQAAFDRAVQMVAEQGIARDEAERRLWMLWATRQTAAA
jgi:hypothetical protein